MQTLVDIVNIAPENDPVVIDDEYGGKGNYTDSRRFFYIFGSQISN